MTAEERSMQGARLPTICQVLHTLDIGGGEVMAQSIALENAGEFRPVFALLDDLGPLGGDLLDQGFVVRVIGRRPGFDLRCVRGLGEFLRLEKVSLIHAHQYGPLLYSAIARLSCLGTPILFTEHGRDYPDYRRWKRVWANRVVLSKADRFVAVGEEVKRALVECEGLPADRIEVIHNGRDLSAYDFRRPHRSAMRSELGLGEDDFVVIQVARLNRLKDLPTAMRVVSVLISDNPQARLLIVGDGEDRPQLERLARELRVENEVLFLGSRPDVARLLQAADAFMLSSISEGIPLTLIEAMATGLPCVATRVGGVPEVIKDGETGLLESAGDHVGIAAQLRRLATNPSLRQQLGTAGRRHVLQVHGASTMHKRYTDLYRQMTRERVSENSLDSKAPA